MNSNRKKYRLFYKIEEHLEIPMFLLAVLWLYFFIIEIVEGLSPTQEYLIYGIWGIFILEFLLKLFLAPRKIGYLKQNIITIVALIIPAFRVLRLLNAFRILGSVRLITSTNIIRALTSGKRFFSALKEAQGPQPSPEMNVGILIASADKEQQEHIKNFIHRVSDHVKREMEMSTGTQWFFDIADTTHLENDNPRYPSDFLDRASLQMAEGPYDLVVVVTDVALMSRKNILSAGLGSSVTRVAVISTKNILSTQRRVATRTYHDEPVQLNTVYLLLHLIGHILGVKHSAVSPLMRDFNFKKSIAAVPSFTEKERAFLKKNSANLPDRELKNGNFLETFIFHLLMTFRHLGKYFKPLLRNWAILLPLSLPNLATAAVAPALILVFTAEIWDVGLGMTNGTATFFAIISIMFGSFYLVRVQNLFLPRKEKRILTEHLAVANAVIYTSVFLACIGLFILVGGLMMIIELYVFPPDLITTWPTLNKPEVTLADKIRLAAFISTVGVTTGALAGGLESKTLIQHLALFKYKT